MKLIRLLSFIFLLPLPQVHQAWGSSHCVSDCHSKEKINSHEEGHQESKSESKEDPSHHHAHHCVHSFALVIDFTTLQNPNSEFKQIVYHFTLHDSEPHLNVFIEPPILSSLTFI